MTGRRRHERRPALLVRGDGVGMAERQTDVVPAVQQAFPGELVQREGGREPGRRCLDGAAGDVDGDLERGVLRHRGQQGTVELGGDLDREQALLGAVVAEDVGETRGDHGLEAVVHERPHGMLA